MRKLVSIILLFLPLWVNGQSNGWLLNFGSQGSDRATAITEDKFGDIITAGIINDTVIFTWGGINYTLFPWRGNCFIIKQDLNGQLIWLRHIGGAGSVNVQDVDTDAHGNFYLTGSFRDTADFNPTSNNFDLISNGSKEDIFVAKYDTWGNFIWAKSIGGLGFDFASTIKIDNDSNVFIAGAYEGAIDFDPGANVHQVNGSSVQDAFVLKLDYAGNFELVYQFGGIGVDFCSDFEVDSHGNLFLTGAFQNQVDFNPNSSIDTLSSIGNLDAYLIKIDSAFTFQWVKRVGGSMQDVALALELDNMHKIYLVGTFEGSCDFDPGIGINQLIANNKQDGFVLKLDSLGNYLWVNKIGGKEDDQVVDVAVDQLYNVYVTGLFGDTVDFNRDTAVLFNLIAQGNYDHYIHQLDSVGAFSWVQQYSGSVSSNSNKILIDSKNNLYATGGFEGTVDFDPTTGINNKTAVGQQDVFIQRIKLNTVVGFSTMSQLAAEDIEIYPNPSQGIVHVELKERYNEIQVRVFDITGSLIKEFDIEDSNSFTIDIEGERGLYIIEVILNGSLRKIVKVLKK
ncbi:MAG: T9SS type A sorting domain-containing protein [Flavobacteriales bacterium]|nr:T9SS type A sorting domain-containing protein [Flavobacteriales bacterium]